MMPEYVNEGDRAYAREQMEKHKELCRLRRLGQLPELPVEYSPPPKKKKNNGYDPQDKVTVECPACHKSREVTRAYYRYQHDPNRVCNGCKRSAHLSGL